MKRVLRRISPAMTVWLTLLWLLVFHSVAPLHVMSGLLVAIVVQVLFPLPQTNTRWRLRTIAIVVLLGVFFKDLVVASWHAIRIVVSGREVTNGVVHVPLNSPDPVHLTIMSAMTSLVPGSLVVKVHHDTCAFDLHVLDLPAQGGVRGVQTKVLKLEQRLLAAVAGTPILPRPNPRLTDVRSSR
ncbi:Na+/H+ antiporter subunit E [Schaalia suimastitidis]|uniref:Na+/H+ antiporter subunit E n=1 Tax=Schaalia suimastitidis TaxID=121163 RepID=UPI000427C49D|nr:Na+/H+ antiporter subunit E [Schaalia suimastitidis]